MAPSRRDSRVTLFSLFMRGLVRKQRQQKDHGFKSMVEHDPEGIVRVLGGVGWAVPIKVKPEEREISIRYQADFLCRVKLPDVTKMYHFEAESNFRTDRGKRALAKSIALALLHEMTVRPVLVLFDPKRPAIKFMPLHEIDLDDIFISARFHVVRLWEEPPDEILAHNRTHLLPMVMAMKSTPEQIREATVRIDMVKPDAERQRLHQEAVTFAAIRYTEAEIRELTGRSDRAMLPPMEVIRETEIGQRIEELGRFKGRQEGFRRGRVETARAKLEQLLRLRFPNLKVAALPSDPARLDELFEIAATATGPAAIRRALRNAAN